MADEIYYKVPGSKLTAIADRTRAMAGTTEGMTLDEIIYWLGRVAYIPQGRVSSELELDSITVETSITGMLPNVVRTSVSSVLALESIIFETSAVEYIEEG